MKKNLLFLYTRAAGYFVACARKFHELFGYHIHFIRFDPDPLAPFQFESDEAITFYNRGDFSDQALFDFAKEIDPVAIYVAGWVDSGYNKVAAHFKEQGRSVICGMDNQWKGTIRQKIGTIASPFIVRNRFSHIWVAGAFQYEFARRLGYHRNNILFGLYSADVDKFAANSYQPTDNQPFPHRFLYVGRMIDVKGIRELNEAIGIVNQEMIHDWRFVLIGEGPLKEEMDAYKNLEMMDFLQPSDLAEEAKAGGVFLLASRSEPWGVVVHEFAAAGFPLVLSDACGARSAFLQDGYNGFVFEGNNVKALVQAIRNTINTPDDELRRMSRRSYERARVITPEMWAYTLNSVI